jgi:hypothetical protein
MAWDGGSWFWPYCTVVLKEGSGDIRGLERVVNQKTHVPGSNCLKMMNPGSDFGFEELRGPGETRREFGFPKNHFLGFMHKFLW